MAIPIAPIRPPAVIDSINLPGNKQSASPQGDFQSLLGDAMGRMQQTQDASESTVQRFLTGENEEVHQIAIQSTQTELQFDMFMAVRNKVVQAYQEIMKMQM